MRPYSIQARTAQFDHSVPESQRFALLMMWIEGCEPCASSVAGWRRPEHRLKACRSQPSRPVSDLTYRCSDQSLFGSQLVQSPTSLLTTRDAQFLE